MFSMYMHNILWFVFIVIGFVFVIMSFLFIHHASVIIGIISSSKYSHLSVVDILIFSDQPQTLILIGPAI